MIWPTAENAHVNMDTGIAMEYVRKYGLLSLVAYTSFALYNSAMLPYIQFPRLQDLPQQPFFGETFRSKEWLLFTPDRLQLAPILYGWMHVIPSIVWLATFPLQFVPYIRKQYPALHRIAGYVNLSIIMLMAASGLCFLPRGLSHSADSIFHIHTLRIPIRHVLHVALRDRSSGGQVPLPMIPRPNNDTGTVLMVWPTFSMLVVWLALGSLTCAWQTVCHARARRLEQHRLWALALAIWLYSVPLHRAIVAWSNKAGSWVGTWPEDLQDALGIPTELDDIVEGEKALFAWTQAVSNIPLGIALLNLRRISRIVG